MSKYQWRDEDGECAASNCPLLVGAPCTRTGHACGRIDNDEGENEDDE